jgi:hypothetical protein
LRILVTGAAGFIGMQVAKLLLERGDSVVGLDNINDYYDPSLKKARLDILAKYPGFSFVKLDVAARVEMAKLFAAEKFQRVIHLAAQAGVRYSIANPHAYVDSNLVGFVNVLEGCRHNGVEHLVYASSSSVYGGNTRMPFSEHQNVDHPISLYAATKKGQRIDGAYLQPSFRASNHGPAILYGLRTMGTARHGAFPVYPRHTRRPADRCIQFRKNEARLYLRRRYCRGRGARYGPLGRKRSRFRSGPARSCAK